MTTLNVGDICCRYKDGVIPPVCFERKSKNDAFGSFSKGYERFRKEIFRAKEQNIQLIIIIECSFTSMLRGCKHSTVKGVSIIKRLWTIHWKYNIPTVYCKNREEMAIYIAEFFCHLYSKKPNWRPGAATPFPDLTTAEPGLPK